MVTQEQNEVVETRADRRRRRAERPRSLWRRLGLGSILFTLTLSIVFGLALILIIGRPITAPDWAKDRITARAAEMMGDVQLRFDTLEFVLRNGWQPHARLRNVQILTGDGAEIAAFSEVETRLAFEPLLRGQALPRAISLSGVFATLRRGADGRVSLSGGLGLGGPSQQAGSIAQLVGGIDQLLEQPALASLREARIQALTLRYEDALSARAWTIDGGRMRLTRQGDDVQLAADLALLSGGQGVATLAANYSSLVGSTASEFGITIEDVDAGDIAAQGPAFAWLEVLRAPISGAMRGGVTATGVLRPLNATLAIGEGVVQPTDATRPIPFSAARTYFTFDPAAQRLDFAEISIDSAWIGARAEGQAWLGGLDEGRLDDLVAQVQLSELRFNPADLYVAPIALEGARMDFRMRLDPFRLELGEMLIEDQGQEAILRGSLDAAPDGWRYALDGRMDGLAPDRLMELWPERLVAKTRAWVAENVETGAFNAIDLALRGAPDARPDTYLSFDFSEVTAKFLRNLPPVRGGRGHATLLRDRFVLAVDGGQITAPEGGVVEVGGTSFILPDVTAGPNPLAVIRAESDSTITAALSLLDQPPLRLMTKAQRPVALADGRARMTGTVSTPLRKHVPPEEIRYDVSGTLSDVRSDVLIEGRQLAAPRLSVTASNDGIEVAGPGRLDAVPFEAVWRQANGPDALPQSTVAGTIEISERALDAFDIGLPPGTVSGLGQGALRVTLPRDPNASPQFVLETDMSGLTVRIPPLGWAKSPSQTGALSVAGKLGGTPTVDLLAIEAPGLTATGRVALTEGGGLAAASFTRVQAGSWLDAPVTLQGRGRGAPPAVVVPGGQIDLRTAPFGVAPADGSAAVIEAAQPPPVALQLDTLQITDSIALTSMRGDFISQNGLDGTFVARVNGGPQVSGRVLPQNGRSAVRITSKDAGGVLAAAGLLRKARGGEMSLTLLPVAGAGAGTFDGTLKVRNTRIQDAPAMAALLSALSIVGLLEQLGGGGIAFSEVEAEFRLTPDQVFLTRASAVGPSIGLSMDGVYDVASRGLRMQGVISPVYLLNGIGSLFTRKGEGLIGFSYRLNGTSDKPKVSVNPLSALTPGMFREIFRAPPPVPQNTSPRTALPEGFAPSPDEAGQDDKPSGPVGFVDDR